MNPILIPIDGSETSLKALRFAISLAQRTNDPLVLINVQQNLRTPNIQRFFSPQEIRSYQEELSQEAFDEAINILESLKIPYEKKLRIGHPAQEICNEATALNASQIIMGSRGAGAIQGKLLGSVSYGVIHEAPCPVTIVK